MTEARAEVIAELRDTIATEEVKPRDEVKDGSTMKWAPEGIDTVHFVFVDFCLTIFEPEVF
jgi:hypothetical protein